MSDPRSSQAGHPPAGETLPCASSTKRYVADWEALTERAGVWIDTADAYRTLDNTYVSEAESA